MAGTADGTTAGTGEANEQDLSDRLAVLEQENEALRRELQASRRERMPLAEEERRTLRREAADAVSELAAIDEHLMAELRASEAALREREAELARVQRIGNIGGLEVGLVDGFHNCRSPEYLRLHGLPPDAAEETHEAWVRRIHPDDRDGVVSAFVETVAGRACDYTAEYRIIRPSDGEVRWIAARAEIERDAEGRALRLIGAHLDVTDRKRVEEALRASEERLTRILESISDAFYALDREGRLVYANQRARTIWSKCAEDILGRRLPDLFPQLVGTPLWLAQERALRTREPARVEAVSAIVGRWLSVSIYPNDDGGIAVYFQDVHERKVAETALAARTVQLETLLATVPVAVWFTDDPQVRRVVRNRYGAELMRLPAAATASLIGSDHEAIEHIRLRHRNAPVAADQVPLYRAIRGEDIRDEEFEFVFTDGTVVTFLCSASPLRDAEGAVTGAVAVGLDITARKQAEGRQHLLVRELHHRVKNTLATVQAIAGSTMRSADSMETFRTVFADRLISLGRTHTLLTDNAWGGADLRDLLCLELEPYDDGAGERIGLSGPDVHLPAEMAVALGMAFHELTTNAVKHGALSALGGRVAVTWSVGEEGTPGLRFEWRESNGPPVTAPTRRGFGSQLLQRVLGAQLDGDVTIDYAPDGVCVVVTAPLTAERGLA